MTTGCVIAGERAVTVVIPTFNRSKLLRRALESVLQERRIKIVAHVFDNASEDDTEAVVRDMILADDRIVYHRNECNIGLVKNFERALASVRTTYFVPLGDDDYLVENFLFDAFEIAERDHALGAVVFSGEARDPDGVLHGTYPARRDVIAFGRLTPPQHMRDWMRYGHYLWSAILWRTEILDLVGPPYIRAGLPSDVDLQAQVFVCRDVFLVDRPGSVYTAHPGQASGGMNVTSIASWSAIFNRMDRQIASTRLFEPAEYADLRMAMWNRYRGIWNLNSETVRDPRTALRYAATAGFGLGDWPLAYTLADRAVPPGDETSAPAGYHPMLPGRNDSLGAVVPSSGRHGLLRDVILSFRQAGAERQALETRISSLAAELEDSKTRCEQGEHALASLATELAGSRTRGEQVDHALAERGEQLAERARELAELRSSLALRTLQRLGLIRQRARRFLPWSAQP